MKAVQTLALYLIGVVGTWAVLLATYGGVRSLWPPDASQLSRSGWPWIELGLMLTLASVAVPWVMVGKVKGRDSLLEWAGMSAGFCAVIAASLVLGDYRPELSWQWSGEAMLWLLLLLHVVVGVSSGRLAWDGIRAPQERAEEGRRILCRALRRIHQAVDQAMAAPEAEPAYPFPVRDPHPSRGDTGSVEAGWDTGKFADGRPYLVECWAENQMTVLSFFFSDRGLEDRKGDDFADLLEEEGILRWVGGMREVSAKRIEDQAGQGVWSASVLVGFEDEVFIEDELSLKPYPRDVEAPEMAKPPGDDGASDEVHDEALDSSDWRWGESHELFREEGDKFRSILLTVSGDDLKIDTYDMGPITEAFWADSDYEFWTIVPRREWRKLIVALQVELGLEITPPMPGKDRRELAEQVRRLALELFSGDERASDHLRGICQRYGVEHEWDSWV